MKRLINYRTTTCNLKRDKKPTQSRSLEQRMMLVKTSLILLLWRCFLFYWFGKREFPVIGGPTTQTVNITFQTTYFIYPSNTQQLIQKSYSKLRKQVWGYKLQLSMSQKHFTKFLCLLVDTLGAFVIISL